MTANMVPTGRAAGRQLRLVHSVEPEDLCPNLRFDPYADGADEAVSTAFFRARSRGEEFEFPHWFGTEPGGAA